MTEALVDRRLALLGELDRINEADRAVAASAMAEIDALSAKLRSAGVMQRWALKRSLAAAQTRWQAAAAQRERNVERMNSLLDEAQAIERELERGSKRT